MLPTPDNNNRVKALKTLATNIPNANEQVAQGLNSARVMQLQNTVKQLRPGMSAAVAGQTLGKEQTEQAGQISLQQQAQTQKQTQELTGQALAEQSIKAEQNIGRERRNLSELGLKNARLLAAIDEDAKDEIIDRQLEFKRNQAGQALLNERQLQDFAILTARNEQELQDYGQAVQNAYERKSQMYSQAAAVLKQSMSQAYTARERQLDNQSTQRIQAAIQAAEEKARRARNKAAGRAGILQAVFTVGGAVAGTLIAPGAGTVAGIGAGTAAGAAVGSALGTSAGGM